MLHSELNEALKERGYKDDYIKKMSAERMFREYCEWHGLIGWAGTLIDVLDAARKFKGKQEDK